MPRDTKGNALRADPLVLPLETLSFCALLCPFSFRVDGRSAEVLRWSSRPTPHGARTTSAERQVRFQLHQRSARSGFTSRCRNCTSRCRNCTGGAPDQGSEARLKNQSWENTRFCARNGSSARPRPRRRATLASLESAAGAESIPENITEWVDGGRGD